MLACGDADAPTAAADVARDIACGETIPVEVRALETSELPGEYCAAVDGGSGEPALDAQVRAVLVDQLADRRVVHLGPRRADDTQAAQVPEQRIERVASPVPGVPLVATMPEEGVDTLIREVAKHESLGLEPPREVGGHVQQIPCRKRRVALPSQLLPEALHVHLEGTSDRHRSWIEHACLLDGEMP